MRSTKGAIAVIGLLALLAIANYAFNMDPTQLAARGVGKDPHAHNDQDTAEADKPPVSDEIVPLGPEGAPITIEVFYDGPGSYAEVFGPVMTTMQAQYADHVRVEFSDLTDPEINARAVKLPLRGSQGLSFNGEVIKSVPGEGNFDTVAFVGQPMDRHWNEGALQHAIEYELTTQGIEFEASAPPPPGAGGDEHAGHDH